MIGFLRNSPIKRKLIAIVLFTSCVALLIACVVFGIYDHISFRRTMMRDMAVVADMVDDNIAPGLTFNDPSSVGLTLKMLAGHPHVQAACVYQSKGTLVSSIRKPGVPAEFNFPPPVKTSQRFKDGRLETFQDVLLSGEVLGTVYVASDLRALRERTWSYAIMVALLMVVCSTVAYLLAGWLQRIITGPMVELARAAKVVTSQRDYSVRAAKVGEDELGRLVDAFNAMLDEIQTRDSALRDARDQLEERVEARTSELRTEVAERQRTEEERDRIFMLSLDMLCVGGFDGRLRRVNPVFEKVLGYSCDEFLTRPFLEFIHAEDRAATAEQVGRLAAGIKVVDFEIRSVCKDGSIRWVAWCAIPLLAEGVFYAYGRDITERRNAATELEEMHRQLLDTSRQAGMAEVATGVLHNVGNVLNSVNVSATLMADRFKKSRVTDLGRVVNLLRDATDVGRFLANDPKGQKVPAFLEQLSVRLAEEQSSHVKELDSLRQNIEHIKEIVYMQQSYAKVSGVREKLRVSDLVEDTLRMNAGAFARHEVQVLRDFQPVSAVTSEKHKIMQILINLIRNAKYACDDSGRTDKRITVRISEGCGRVQISVTDNGVGIPTENLNRIFNHGFTTRKDGHGFGLHSGALAAKELGGSLRVYSDGPGFGATFTLELPAEAQD